MGTSKKPDWRSKFTKDQVLTIPNMLSAFRVILIPFIIWTYCGLQSSVWTMVLIAISCISDMADGYIARHYNMITDFGKTIDPIADKLTQGAILFCLLTRFSLMWMLIGLMAVKEAVCLTLRAWLFKKTELIHGAEWHGKLNTSLLYATMCLHVIWYTIPSVVSVVTICIATAMMLLSFVLYVLSTMQYWKEYKDQNA